MIIIDNGAGVFTIKDLHDAILDGLESLIVTPCCHGIALFLILFLVLWIPALIAYALNQFRADTITLNR